MKKLLGKVLILLLTGMGCWDGRAQIDADGNGLGDIWEALYPAQVSLEADTDRDGASTRDEWAAGTDPMDPESSFRILACHWREEGSVVCVRWQAVPGKSYLVEARCLMDESGQAWLPLGGYDHEGEAEEVEVSLLEPEGSGLFASGQCFVRLVVGDRDDDGDGLTAWEEGVVGTEDTSESSGETSDMERAREWLRNNSKPSPEDPEDDEGDDSDGDHDDNEGDDSDGDHDDDEGEDSDGDHDDDEGEDSDGDHDDDEGEDSDGDHDDDEGEDSDGDHDDDEGEDSDGDHDDDEGEDSDGDHDDDEGEDSDGDHDDDEGEDSDGDHDDDEGEDSDGDHDDDEGEDSDGDHDDDEGEDSDGDHDDDEGEDSDGDHDDDEGEDSDGDHDDDEGEDSDGDHDDDEGEDSDGDHDDDEGEDSDGGHDDDEGEDSDGEHDDDEGDDSDGEHDDDEGDEDQDGEGEGDDDEGETIDINSVPVLAANQLAIDPGQALVLTPENLRAVDANDPISRRTLMVSDVVAGQFERVASPGVAVSSFAQSDVNSGAIQFVHDGSENPPAFQTALSDGLITTLPTPAAIRFGVTADRSVPVLIVNQLGIARGQTLVLTANDLRATDRDTSVAGLLFEITDLQGGWFALSSRTAISVSQFSQENVNRGDVVFVHNGDDQAPSYSVVVTDGRQRTEPVAALVRYRAEAFPNLPPRLTANSLVINGGDPVRLGVAQLDAVDPDASGGELRFDIADVSGGRFERIGAPGQPVTAFAHSDLINRSVQFVPDGSGQVPQYQVTVSDGMAQSAPLPVSAMFCRPLGMMMEMDGMMALQNLVAPERVTHRAVASGRWSDPTVWAGGVVPSNGARVHIPAGVAVVVASELEPAFKTVRVDGLLRFSPVVNTRLKVDTLASFRCGRVEMGTASLPIDVAVTAQVVFADDGPIDLNDDFAQLGRGAILHGQTVIHGAERSNRAALAIHPTAGSNTLVLKSAPAGWLPGDELVVTGTLPNNPVSDEIRVIRAIDGVTVTLDTALAIDHVAPRSDLNVYVANLTRNVILSSANPEVGRRGHIMFMHTLAADVNYARFNELGRTDKRRPLDDVSFEFDEDRPGNFSSAPIHFRPETGPRTNIRGRYPIHLHRGGTDPTTQPAIVRGSVVFGSPGWGFVSHSAHARFIDNVSYAVQGTGFYTEAGDEVGEMVGNIAIRSVNSNFQFDSLGGAIDPDLGFDQQEFGNDGDGYWLSGNLVSLRNNVSAGSTAHGIIYWTDGLVEADIPRGRTTVKVSEIPNGHLIPNRETIPVWWAPLAEVSGNECYGSSVGFRIRYIHGQSYMGEGGSPFHASPPQAYIDTLDPVVDRLTVWGNRDGMLLNYTGRMSVKNSLIVGIGAPFILDGGTANSGVGLDQGTEITNGSGRIENVTIEGFEMGYVVPINDQWTMTNLTLRNVTDMLIAAPRQSPRTITMSQVRFEALDGTAVAGRTGRQNIRLMAEFEDTGFQPFWFVMPDRITIDGEGVYYNQQAADFAPYTFPPEETILPIPSGYRNRTNQQLQDSYGVSFGGAILPADARRVDYVTNGWVGSAAPAATVFPQLLDMTNGGESPEPPKGGPQPELTGSRLEIGRGATVTLMETNLNTTDTDSGLAELTYTVSGVANGFFAHRDAPGVAITTFTQAQVNGGVIRFTHDGSAEAPRFDVRVSDGQTTTANQGATVRFSL